MTGSAGQRRVPEAYLAELDIPLPPIEEQRRIADILDRADALRAQRRQSLALLEHLGDAVFRRCFGDVTSNELGWDESIQLDDVAEVSSGITVGRRIAAGAATRSVPFMAVVNVQDKRLDLSTIKRIDATDAEVERFKLEFGDLLLTEGGDPDKLGRGTLWQDDLEEAIHQNHIFRVRVKADRVRPIYLSWLIRSPRGKAYFLKSAKQTTGIASINMTQLRRFPLIVPPVEDQVRFEQSLRAVTDAQSAASAHLATVDSLFASLQHRAFAGLL